MTRKHRLIAVFLTLLVPALVIANNLSLPHRFTSGGPILASEMNENFDAVVNAVPLVFRFVAPCPDGGLGPIMPGQPNLYVYDLDAPALNGNPAAAVSTTLMYREVSWGASGPTYTVCGGSPNGGGFFPASYDAARGRWSVTLSPGLAVAVVADPHPAPTPTPSRVYTYTPPTCTPANCNGCCTSAGTCAAAPNNSLNATCGAQGAACVDCAASAQVCDPSTHTCQ